MTPGEGSRSRDRAVAAAWFGAWGALVAGHFFLDSALGHGVGTAVVFVGLPGLAAGTAGGIVGPRLLDAEEGGHLQAAALGMLAVVLAHLLYGPLVAADWWLTETNGTGAWALGAAVSTLGFAMMALITVPVGALAGWLLWVLRGR